MGLLKARGSSDWGFHVDRDMREGVREDYPHSALGSEGFEGSTEGLKTRTGPQTHVGKFPLLYEQSLIGILVGGTKSLLKDCLCKGEHPKVP